MRQVDVQFDHNADGTPEGAVAVWNPGDSFTYEPRAYDAAFASFAGPVTLNARTIEHDYDGTVLSTSNWQPFNFTLESAGSGSGSGSGSGNGMTSASARATVIAPYIAEGTSTVGFRIERGTELPTVHYHATGTAVYDEDYRLFGRQVNPDGSVGTKVGLIQSGALPSGVWTTYDVWVETYLDTTREGDEYVMLALDPVGYADVTYIGPYDYDRVLIYDTDVHVEVDTDSNNDGLINEDDDSREMESPGRIILLDSTTGVGGLAEVKLGTWAENFTYYMWENTGIDWKVTLSGTGATDSIRIWTTPAKNHELVLGTNTSWLTGVPGSIWVEGLAPGEVTLQLTASPTADNAPSGNTTVVLASDEARITVAYGVSLTIENDLIAANDNDDDNDGVPDYADGYNLDNGQPDASARDDSTAGERFTELTVTIPDWIDTSTAFVTFSYDASDPLTNVSRHGGDPYYTYPSSGGTWWWNKFHQLRIWTKPGADSREGHSLYDGGDFVASGQPYLLSELGVSPGDSELVLYVEGIGPARGQIQVTVDPGEGYAAHLRSQDKVDVTVVQVDLDVDSDNNYTLERSLYEDHYENLANAPNWPGKFVPNSHGDADGDGVPDFVDGIFEYAHVGNSELRSAPFTPMVFEIAEPIDLNVARFRFKYNASDPTAITYNASFGTLEAASGNLRLWTRDGNQARYARDIATTVDDASSQTGNYIRPDTFYSWANLTNSAGASVDGRKVTLYIEGILGGSHLEIGVEVDPNGMSQSIFSSETDPLLTPTFLVSDKVVVNVPKAPTIESVAFIQVSGDGYGTLDLDTNPNGGDRPKFKGGDRFFPDAKSFADRNTGNNIVRVRAIITGDGHDVVYFRAYDVDDPSNDIIIDPNGDVQASGSKDNRGRLGPVTIDAPGGTVGASHNANAGGFEGYLRAIDAHGIPQAWQGESMVVAAPVREVMINGVLTKIAEVDLATSYAPGDNFRVGASFSEAAIKRVDTLPTADPYRTVTKQLSVWRYFHIEQDRMATTTSADRQTANIVHDSPAPLAGANVTVAVDAAITQANQYGGGILRKDGINYKVVGNTTGTNHLGTVSLTSDDLGGGVRVVSIDLTASATVTANELAHGKLVIYDVDSNGNLQRTGDEYDILANDARINSTFVTVSIKGPGIAPHVSVRIFKADATVEVEAAGIITAGAIALYEDDFVASDGANGEPISRVDTAKADALYGFLQNTTNREDNRFAEAYLVPRVDTLDEFDSIIASNPHVSDHDELDAIFRANSGLGFQRTDYLWAVYVSSAYEPARELDRDANDEPDPLMGVTLRASSLFDPIPVPAPDLYASFIYMETVIDVNSLTWLNDSESLAAVTVHEVGHQFGLASVGNVLGEHVDVPRNIMSSGGVQISRVEFFFRTEDIVALRERTHSPGYDPLN